MQKSPYQLKTSAEKRDRFFKTRILKNITLEKFNKFQDVDGNNYKDYLGKKKDNPNNRLLFYRRLSTEKRNSIRELGEEVLKNYTEKYPKKKEELIQKEKKVYKKKPIETKQKEEKREQFIKEETKKVKGKYRKTHASLIQRVKDNPNLPIKEAIFQPTYNKENWFNTWKSDRSGKYTIYEKRIIKSYEKHSKTQDINSLQELRRIIKDNGW